jgi:hypothetical protein
VKKKKVIFLQAKCNTNQQQTQMQQTARHQTASPDAEEPGRSMSRDTTRLTMGRLALRHTYCTRATSRLLAQDIQVSQRSQMQSSPDDSRARYSRHTHRTSYSRPLGNPEPKLQELCSSSTSPAVHSYNQGLASSIILWPARGGRIPRCSPRVLDIFSTSTSDQSGPAEER